MDRRDISRIIEAKSDEYSARVIADLQELPGNTWYGFAEDLQRGHSILFAEYERLLERVCNRLAQSIPPAELELFWFGSEASKS
jgi:hypothetical protein